MPKEEYENNNNHLYFNFQAQIKQIVVDVRRLDERVCGCGKGMSRWVGDEMGRWAKDQNGCVEVEQQSRWVDQRMDEQDIRWEDKQRRGRDDMTMDWQMWLTGTSARNGKWEMCGCGKGMNKMDGRPDGWMSKGSEWMCRGWEEVHMSLYADKRMDKQKIG